MLDELNSTISLILEKLDLYKGKGILSEADTKASFIAPVLQSLGWDVFSFEEVQSEYKVYDGSFVDYALKISGEPKIFIEAKALDVELDDHKLIGQIVKYAAVEKGLKWCVLTNGNEYRLYKSDEGELHPPERIVFEVSVEDCKNSEKRLFFIEMIKHLSKDSVESGELDQWASELFLENRIRKIMQEPSDEFLSSVKNEISTSATDEQVKTAMKNVLKGYVVKEKDKKTISKKKVKYKGIKELIALANEKQLDIFDKLEEFILSLGDDVQKKETKYYYAYRCVNKNFACVEVHPKIQTILIYLKIKPKTLDSIPEIARDVTDIGHYGTGDLELRVHNLNDLEVAKPLVRKSYEIS